MSQQQREKSLRGTITAAELAVSQDDYRTAEKALLDALAAVRKHKSSGGKR